MHSSPRNLPFFSRLDDGRIVERRRPSGEALAVGGTRAQLSGGDRLLMDLASQALDRPPGSTLMTERCGATTAVEAPPDGGLSVIGLRCPPATAAVSSSVQCRALCPEDRRRRGVLAWSVDRHGRSLALLRNNADSSVQSLSSIAGTLLDAALCALGRPTPPCPSPTVWFPDGVFMHRVSAMLARRRGLCDRRRLSWDSLSVLHPLNGAGAPIPPGTVRRLRQRFQASNTWSSLRRGVAGLPEAAPAILPGLTPPIAGWLDDGAFARWVLSRVSDAPSALQWLRDSLCGPVADHLALALGDVHDASAVSS